MVFPQKGEDQTQCLRFLEAARQPLASSLLMLERATGGWLSRSLRRSAHIVRGWRGSILAIAGVLLVAAMFIPYPYDLNCECRLEPVTRRFVEAPFDGTLAEVAVQPGDQVRQGQLLARLDGRKLNWDRAALVAGRNQAVKRRDSAQAAHGYSEQQIAELEIQRLDVKLRLLDDQVERLEPSAPTTCLSTGIDLWRRHTASSAPRTGSGWESAGFCLK